MLIKKYISIQSSSNLLNISTVFFQQFHLIVALYMPVYTIIGVVKCFFSNS